MKTISELHGLMSIKDLLVHGQFWREPTCTKLPLDRLPEAEVSHCFFSRDFNYKVIAHLTRVSI